jgi:hypothetical protein
MRKLAALIEQRRVEFGCAVRVQFVTSPTSVGFKWQETPYRRNLWSVDVWMPVKDEPGS